MPAWIGAAFLHGDEEGRRAERTGQRLAEDPARCGRGRRHAEAQRRCGRLRPCRQAQQEDRSPGGPGLAVQTAGGGQIQPGRFAMQLEDDGRKPGDTGGLAGDPQRIATGTRVRQHDPFRRDGKGLLQTFGIRKPGFAHAFAGGDPQQRPLRRRGDGEAGKAKDKTARRPGIAHLSGMDLAQGIPLDAAAQRPVEAGGARGEAASGPAAILRCGEAGPAGFEGSDLTAQERNSVPRHGVLRHVRQPQQMFTLCSNGFQTGSPESSGI